MPGFASKRRALFLLMTSLTATSPALSGEVDCKTIGDRPALATEHEICALKDNLTGDALASHFNDKVWPDAYVVAWKDIPEAERKRFEAFLGFKPEDKAELVVVTKTKKPWTKKLYKSRKQAAGGGGLLGSVLRLCLVDGEHGHYEITRTEARHLGWPEAAATFLAKASRDADYYEWYTAAAHAQTPNLQRSHKPGNVADAKKAFKKLLSEHKTTMAKECTNGRPERALYVLGYVLHAIQDLSTHAGQTNAEHSYRSLIGENPDAHPKSIKRAHTWTKEILEVALPAGCGAAMKNVSGQGDVSAMATSLFGSGDGDAAAMLAFEALGIRYLVATKTESIKPDTFWFRTDDGAKTFFSGEVKALFETPTASKR